MKFPPRQYQLECVQKIREAFRRGDMTALVKLPTAAGKSFTAGIFIDQILSVKADYRVAILVPKVKIIREFVDVLNPTLVTIASHSYGQVDTTGQIMIATFQTLANRDLPVVDLVIADEVHRLNDTDDKSQYYSVVKRFIDLNPDTRVLGLTATPFRDTGYIYGPDKFFPKPVFERDLIWTTENKFTVPARLYGAPEDLSFDTAKLSVDNTGEYKTFELNEIALDMDKARSQVEDILNKTANRKKVAVACTSIKHAEIIGKLIQDRGHECVVIHSEKEDDVCDEDLGFFETDPECRYVTFVTMIAEGFNFPPIDAIALLRPTRRANLYCQIIGRGLRLSPDTGKTDCMVLDYGHVIENCGPLDNPYVNKGGKRGLEAAQENHEQRVILCTECGAFNFVLKVATQADCRECGCVLPIKTPRTVDTNLEAKAAVIDLYSKTEPKKYASIATSVRYTQVGKTQEVQRRRKRVVVVMQDGTEAQFFVTNPEFAVIDGNAKYDQKKWLEGIERKIAQMIFDITGKRIDMRDLNEYTLKAVNAVEVDWEFNGQYAKYKSHKIIEDYSLPNSNGGDAKEHVNAVMLAFPSAKVVKRGPMNKDDKNFLKRGF